MRRKWRLPLNNLKRSFLGVMLCLSLLPVGTLAAAKQVNSAATLINVVGLVELKQVSNWVPVGPGQLLADGNQLRTAKTGMGEILFRDGTLLRISKNSFLTIAGPTETGKGKKIGFESGDLWVKVKKGTPFTIESSIAVASVKGTEFALSKPKGEETEHLVVWDGIVNFSTGAGNVDVRKSEQASTSKGAMPVKSGIKQAEMDKIQTTYKIEPRFSVSHSQSFENAQLSIQLKLNNIDPKKIEKVTKEAVVASLSPGLKLSQDKATFSENLPVQFRDSEVMVYVQAEKPGSYKLCVSGENMTPYTFVIQVEEIKSVPVSEQESTAALKGKLTVDDVPYDLEVIYQK